MPERYISIDLETTGLSVKEDEIIEIGAVRIESGKEVDSFHTLVKPSMKISNRITDLTGITNDEVKDCPIFAEIQQDLLTFLGEDILLGQRLLFDYSFIKRSLVHHGGISNKGNDTFARNGIDTLRIAREKLPQLESKTLSALCEYYRIDLTAHRALNDARATALLYEKMKEEFGIKKEDYLQELVHKVKREGPASKAQKERLYQQLEKHHITPDYDVERLTKNKASRYLDMILAEYGR